MALCFLGKIVVRCQTTAARDVGRSIGRGEGKDIQRS
jgi:hypothetical protein